MANYDRDGRSRRGSGPRTTTSRPYEQGSRTRIEPQGPYHGPRGTRQRSSSSRRSSGPGYPLRARNINFQSSRARRINVNRRLLIVGLLALLIIVLLVVGISSCVSSCSSQGQSDGNGTDSRVATGISEELTSEFSTALDQGEKLAQIAAKANEYDDEALLELALSEPSAIDFVAAYPDAEKVAQPYEDAVSQGTVPELYCWDTRWGFVDYAGSALAVTGSGPTSLSMAYMGLTGKGDVTPADAAQLVTDADMASGDSLMSGEFLTESLDSLGLSCSTYTSNADNLVQMLNTGSYVLMETTAGTLGESAHWIVVVSEEDDGSVRVYDPTSPETSSRTWDPATIAASGDTLYALSTTTTTSDDSGSE